MAVSRSVTAYQQVAEALRRRILRGNLQPGAQLPTEMELCEQFAVSRITVRRALQILEEESLIQRFQGKGAFVSPSPARRIAIANTDFMGSLAAHAPDMGRRLEAWDWRQADAEVATALRLPAGDRVLFLRRIDLLDGQPVAYDDVHIPADFADGLKTQDMAALDFLERWTERQRLQLSHLQQTVEAIESTAEAQRLLALSSRKPLLKATEVFHLADERPAIRFVSYYRHDRFRLSSVMPLTQVASRTNATLSTDARGAGPARKGRKR